MKGASVSALVALLPAGAMAAGAEHDVHHGVPWLKLAFSTINLLIFVYILHRYAWPMIRQWVSERRHKVVQALEQAARAKSEAERLQAEWQERLANLDAELEELRRQAAEDIAAERDEIIKAAKELAHNLRREAERAAEQEVRNAQAQLRAALAKQAFELACRLAPQQVTGADQARFVDEFIERVQR